MKPSLLSEFKLSFEYLEQDKDYLAGVSKLAKAYRKKLMERRKK
jgi:hypothetical protein